MLPPPSSSELSLDLRDKLHFMTSVGSSAMHSELLPGLLVRGQYGVTQQLLEAGAGDGVVRTPDGAIVTALFDISMAGDLAEGEAMP